MSINNVHVYSTLAMLVVMEEEKETPGPMYHTRTIRTCKHKTSGYPVALRTGMVGKIFYG